MEIGTIGRSGYSFWSYCYLSVFSSNFDGALFSSERRKHERGVLYRSATTTWHSVELFGTGKRTLNAPKHSTINRKTLRSRSDPRWLDLRPHTLMI